MKVQFHSSMSTFFGKCPVLFPNIRSFICEYPILFTNIRSFIYESPVSLSNIHFFIYECPVSFTNVHFYSSLSTFSIKVRFHSPISALSSIITYFFQLIPALFKFKCLSNTTKTRNTDVSLLRVLLLFSLLSFCDFF